MKSLTNLSPIFNFLKKKDEEPKEPTFTLSEVMSILEQALWKSEEDTRDINWNVDVSNQLEEVFNSVNDCFEKLITDYVEMRKENNS